MEAGVMSSMLSNMVMSQKFKINKVYKYGQRLYQTIFKLPMYVPYFMTGK
jgi:hypothetical protein